METVVVLKETGRKVHQVIVVEADVVKAPCVSESLVVDLMNAVVRKVQKLQLREIGEHTGTDVPEVVVVEPEVDDGGADRLKVIPRDPGDVIVAEVDHLDTGVGVPHGAVHLEVGNAVVAGIDGEGGEGSYLVKGIQVEVLHLVEGQVEVA